MLRLYAFDTSGSDNGTLKEVGQLLDIANRHTGIRPRERLSLTLLLPKIELTSP